EDGDNFHQHHHVIGFRRLADAANQNDGEEHHDDERGPVETEMPPGAVKHVAFEVGKTAGKIGGRNPAGIGMDAEPVQQVDEVLRKADADGHVADGVLENEIPADDPGDEFAHGGVGVRVGAARDGNHGGKFGV